MIQVVESRPQPRSRNSKSYPEPYLVTTVKRIYADQPATSNKTSKELHPAVGLNAQWEYSQESNVYLTLNGDVAGPRNEWEWIWRLANRRGYYDGKLVFTAHDLREIGLAGYVLATQMLEVAIVAKQGRQKPKRRLRPGEHWIGEHEWRLIIPAKATR